MEIKSCADGGYHVKGFSVCATPLGQPAAPGAQLTTAHLCHDAEGLHIHENASTGSHGVFSSASKCGDSVFTAGDVLEVFIAPVKKPTDVPEYYHELDTGAAGAMWASCIQHSGDGANSSVMTCANPAKVGKLKCSGLATFDSGLTVKVTNASDLSWFATNMTIPWKVFPDWARKSHDHCWHLGCSLPKSASNDRANRADERHQRHPRPLAPLAA